MLNRRNMLSAMVAVAAGAAAPVSVLSAADKPARRLPWRNWSGSQKCLPEARVAPASLAELRRVTAPGGEVILTTPNSYALIFRAIALVGLTPEKIQRDDHLHFFDRKDIDRLCPDGEVLGYFPYMWIKRTIRRDRRAMVAGVVVLTAMSVAFGVMGVMAERRGRLRGGPR